MKEQDLIDLGFEKKVIIARNTCHYYIYDLTEQLSLISSDNEEAKDNGWYVSMFENDLCRIFSKTELELIIHIINKNTIQ